MSASNMIASPSTSMLVYVKNMNSSEMNVSRMAKTIPDEFTTRQIAVNAQNELESADFSRKNIKNAEAIALQAKASGQTERDAQQEAAVRAASRGEPVSSNRIDIWV